MEHDFGKPPTRIVVEPAAAASALGPGVVAWDLGLPHARGDRFLLQGRGHAGGRGAGLPGVLRDTDQRRTSFVGVMSPRAAPPEHQDGGGGGDTGQHSVDDLTEQQQQPLAAGELAAAALDAGQSARARRCAPSLAAVHLPFWRAAAVLALSLALCLFVERDPAAFRHAWALAWPLALVAVACEALYIVESMYREKARGVLIGLRGLVRLLDVWLAWALCFGNVFMVVHIYGRHGDFAGMTTLSANATMLEAWGFFASFSLIASFGGGLVGMEPATGWTRLAVTSFMVLTCIFVVLVVYAGTTETAVRRERQPRPLR